MARKKHDIGPDEPWPKVAQTLANAFQVGPGQKAFAEEVAGLLDEVWVLDERGVAFLLPIVLIALARFAAPDELDEAISFLLRTANEERTIWRDTPHKEGFDADQRAPVREWLAYVETRPMNERTREPFERCLRFWEAEEQVPVRPPRKAGRNRGAR